MESLKEARSKRTSRFDVSVLDCGDAVDRATVRSRLFGLRRGGWLHCRADRQTAKLACAAHFSESPPRLLRFADCHRICSGVSAAPGSAVAPARSGSAGVPLSSRNSQRCIHVTVCMVGRVARAAAGLVRSDSIVRAAISANPRPFPTSTVIFLGVVAHSFLPSAASLIPGTRSK